ncbi:MAG: DNA recombination protein RmuC [Gammaproteobacteria bacterium]|nr:DNA recombination protein RmuC [Gammaproteobacteria bacterium]
MEISQPSLLIIVSVISIEIGAIAAYLIGNRQITRLRNKLSRLTVALSYERKAAAQKEASFQQTTRNLKETFNALAGNVLKENSAQFLRLAQENLKQFQVKADSDLARREQAVENLVKPIREALDKTESQIRNMEKERQEAHGALTRHLETMADSHRLLQSETRNLVQALRRPEVRGQWGELTLKRLAELAGMVEHCDFHEQESVQTDNGTQRPDMVIRMPDKREIVVDSKTPLDTYLAAVEAGDDEARKRHLQRHARNVRERVRELAGKAYWEQFPRSPDFIVLFIPGDQFLSSALEIDHKLLEDALSDNVILATPTSLVALLRAIAYGWRQEALAENAELIRVVGTELYLRLATFAEHLAKLGRSLDSSVDAFNKAVGSFDSRVLPGARKFTELGIASRKQPPDLQQIERATRRVESRCEPESAH